MRLLRGVTVIEICVVAVLGAVIMVAVWSAIIHLTQSDRLTDREAVRSILLARITEMMQLDIRSAVKVDTSQQEVIKITRNIVDPRKRDGSLKVVTVLWTVEKGDSGGVDKVCRQVDDDPVQEFRFDRDLSFDSKAPSVQFRVKKEESDLIFADDLVATPGGK